MCIRDRCVAGCHQLDPADRGEAPVQLDDVRDVDAVALPQVGVDVVVDLLELLPELVDLLATEPLQRILNRFGFGHVFSYFSVLLAVPAITTRPSSSSM